MNKTKRATRIHELNRLKKKRSRYWGGINLDDKRRLGMVTRTPKPCSCLMCRNRRADEGESLQEKRASIDDAIHYFID